jgi:hypothetical protein
MVKKLKRPIDPRSRGRREAKGRYPVPVINLKTAKALAAAACDHPAEGPGELARTSGVSLLRPIGTRMHEAVMAAA